MTRIDFDCDELIELRLPPVHFTNYIKLRALIHKNIGLITKDDISSIMRFSSFNKLKRILEGTELELSDCLSLETPKKTDLITNLNNKIKKKDIFEYYRSMWNDFADKYSLPTVSVMTDARKNGVISRINQKGFDFDLILDMISESRFLTGRSTERFRVSFDFIFLSPNKWVKILEGNYSDVKPESVNMKNIFEETNES